MKRIFIEYWKGLSTKAGDVILGVMFKPFGIQRERVGSDIIYTLPPTIKTERMIEDGRVKLTTHRSGAKR